MFLDSIGFGLCKRILECTNNIYSYSRIISQLTVWIKLRITTVSYHISLHPFYRLLLVSYICIPYAYDLKRWDTGRINIWPEIKNIWKIFESNWLDIESQFSSNILQLLGIPGWILVLPVTHILGQNDSIFSFSAESGLTENWPNSVILTWRFSQCENTGEIAVSF